MTQSDLSTVDLTNCEREPIHVPGRIQPHGVLIVLSEPDLIVTHASTNLLDKAAIDLPAAVGHPLAKVLGEGVVAQLRARLKQESIESNPSYIGNISAGDTTFHAIMHRFKGRLFLELEPAVVDDELTFQNLYGLVRVATGRLKGAASVADLCAITAEEVQRISGFDRVMVYRFDADWHGTVVAEALGSGQSYLDHRFPATDIPPQARQLYLLNRLRLIADVNSTPVAIYPDAAAGSRSPVDLSYVALRSVSPVHIEYLRNMGVAASMSISIVEKDRLWGLVACHHHTPKPLPFEVRAACEHLSEIVALQLAAKAYAEEAEYRITLKSIQSTLLAHMAAHENFVDGLVKSPDQLLGLTSAGGAAVYIDGVLHTVGNTPTEAQTQELIDWLATRNDEENQPFFKESLHTVYPPAAAYQDVASGILALAIPRFRKSFIVWFRSEQIESVKWAGDPHKPAMPANTGGTIHPRKSFETWKQTVRGKSAPWKRAEVSAAIELREAVVAIILRKAEELAVVNAELQRSNKELEAFSYSVSHDLRAPFRHIFGFSDLLLKRASDALDATSRRYLSTIMDSAKFAGVLVDSLLAFSQMSRTSLKLRAVDLKQLVEETRRELQPEIGDRPVEWRVADLPSVTGDVVMLRLALRNLLGNAVKYSRTRERPVIEIGWRDEEERQVFWVRDNGVGFDMRFKDKLFGVFQRLHRPEDFEGTGIGLANVRRTIERHGGETWAEGELDVGATFYFSLPRRKEAE